MKTSIHLQLQNRSHTPGRKLPIPSPSRSHCPLAPQKPKLKVLFTTQTLTLHVDTYPLQNAGDSPPVPIPHYSGKALWDSESLEKYTATLRSGEDTSGPSLGHGMPSLLEGEVDEEANASVGRKAWVTWVDIEGGIPAWSQKQHRTGTSAAWEEKEESVTLHSTPIPGGSNNSSSSKTSTAPSSLDISNSLAKSVWRHTSTYSALSFVLASKQDTRFTYHLGDKAVLAFEGGSIRDHGANVYIYRPPVKKKDIWAKQAVLQVDNGSSGVLLGVGCVKVQGGDDGEVVVCLTEGELVFIRGI